MPKPTIEEEAAQAERTAADYIGERQARELAKRGYFLDQVRRSRGGQATPAPKPITLKVGDRVRCLSATNQCQVPKNARGVVLSVDATRSTARILFSREGAECTWDLVSDGPVLARY